MRTAARRAPYVTFQQSVTIMAKIPVTVTLARQTRYEHNIFTFPAYPYPGTTSMVSEAYRGVNIVASNG